MSAFRATRRHASSVLHVLAVLLLAPAPATAQLAGENVNMVSGTTWPGGDPFLQRQNEPSVAVSSANPLHLLAGANDYRTVDLPFVVVDKAVGDAWLGVFKSFDGGQTWQSVLLPGFPQDRSPEGVASPLHGFGTAADPVVRAGTDGLFYLSGIAFDRGSNLGLVFVTRFLDRNDKENGDATAGRDPIVHLAPPRAIDWGTAGQFVDKPWLAVDAPRPGAATCALPDGRAVRAGNVYLVYATFTGSGANASKILFTRSTDCGDTWSTPQKLSESNSLNQGTVAAVDPLTGTIHVAWRRFATSSQSDAILYARSTDGGLTFTKGRVIADALPFEQDLASDRFRAHAFPALAVSVDGSRSFVHVAWSRRTGPAGDGRIVVMTSADGGGTWSAPAAADDAPLVDDAGNALARGHQLMPALSFSQGQLVLAYYDSRLDHTRGYFRPNQPFLPDALGRFYAELRGPRGELVSSPGLVYGPTIDDAGLTEVRHTLDVRVAVAGPGAAPAFSSERVSRYRFGTRGDEVPGETEPAFGNGVLRITSAQGDVQLLQELQSNPPNLRLFKQGTVPFMGDYIDVAGSAFVRLPGGGWAHDTARSPAPVHHVVWTSNQDVRPPADGNWQNYTPVGGGGQSVFDPTQTSPGCVPGQEGMRNQNVYTSRITSGLQVGSPQNVKPLSAGMTRAFVVSVLNATASEHAFRIEAAPPPGVDASFRNDVAGVRALEVVVPARSTAFRSLFVRLAGETDPGATIPVTVREVADDPACLGAQPPACPDVQGGLSGFVTLNPPGARPSLVQPDGAADDVGTIEVYVPALASANVTSANVTSPTLPAGSAANITSANVTSFHLANPELANVTSANVTSANVTSANVTSANVTSGSLSTANVTSAPISDASYTVTNDGNTTHSYRVVVVGSAPPGTPLQLIVARTYQTPLALGCQLVPEPHEVVVASVPDVSGVVIPPGATLPAAGAPDPAATNVTLALAPGESARVILRGVLDVGAMAQVTQQLAPAVGAHGGGGYVTPLLVTTDGAALGDARVGVPYRAELRALGGTGPYAWALATGSAALPPGLALSSSGVLAGTPTATGAFAFTVQAVDASGGTARRDLALTVRPGPTTTSLTLAPAAPLAGQPVTLGATVSASAPGPGVPVPSGTVTFLDGGAPLGTSALSAGTATLGATLSAGSHSLVAQYGGDASYTASASPPRSLSVAAAGYAFTGFLSPLAPAGTLESPGTSPAQRFGSAVPLKWQLRDAGGAVLTAVSTTRLLQAYLVPACAGPPLAGATVVTLYQPTSGATGGSTFRYDAKNQQFVFNWDTSSGVVPGCWEVVLTLADGSGARATIVPLR